MTRSSSQTPAAGAAAMVLAAVIAGSAALPARALAPADAPALSAEGPAVVIAEGSGELDLRLGREAAAKIAARIEDAPTMPVFLEPETGALSYRPGPPAYGLSPELVIDPDQSPAEPSARPIEGDTLANALDGLDVHTLMLRLVTPLPF